MKRLLNNLQVEAQALVVDLVVVLVVLVVLAVVVGVG